MSKPRPTRPDHVHNMRAVFKACDELHAQRLPVTARAIAQATGLGKSTCHPIILRWRAFEDPPDEGTA